ncbi:MAG: preprotein translocase subunit YajC [Thermodesulfovibrionales bacterium]|nr:preprotein translocase subunit YajC [Thermodesulfovibrionales bacterium]
MSLFNDLLANAYAMGAPPQGSSGKGFESIFMTFFPIMVIFVIFYLLLIRPQQQRAKEHKKMMDNLKKGDTIITTGGLYGVVEAIGIHTVTLKISEDVKVKIAKNHILALVNPEET